MSVFELILQTKLSLYRISRKATSSLPLLSILVGTPGALTKMNVKVTVRMLVVGGSTPAGSRAGMSDVSEEERPSGLAKKNGLNYSYIEAGNVRQLGDRNGKLVGLAAIVILAIVYFWAIPSKMRESIGETRTDRPVSSSRPIDLSDATVKIACRDFARFMEDVEAGVLSAAEMRERAKDIRANTRLVPGEMKAAGDDLLSSFTTGTLADVTKAMGRLSKCLRSFSKIQAINTQRGAPRLGCSNATVRSKVRTKPKGQ